MLPAPDEREVWRGLVQGPACSSVAVQLLDDGALQRVRRELQERGVLRTAVKEAVGITTSVLSWGYTTFAGPKVVSKGLQFVGQYLPLPVFQPAYDIDAETKILEPLAKFAGYILTGRFTPSIILRDRSIPMPVDKDGFVIGEAKFFPVWRDGEDSFASYTPQGRSPKPWHMSKTYITYQKDLAKWKKGRPGGQHAASVTAVQQASKARGVDQAGKNSKAGSA